MECTLEQAAEKEVEVSQRATVSQCMKSLSAPSTSPLKSFSCVQACVQLPAGLFCPILGTEAGSLVFPLQLLRPVYQEDAIPEGELSTVPEEVAEVSCGRAQLSALSSEAFLMELGLSSILT